MAGGFDQPIQHNTILVVACKGHKSCFPVTPIEYPDVLGCATEFQFVKMEEP